MIRAADSATKLIGIRVARLSAASSRGPASGESATEPAPDGANVDRPVHPGERRRGHPHPRTGVSARRQLGQ